MDVCSSHPSNPILIFHSFVLDDSIPRYFLNIGTWRWKKLHSQYCS